MSYCDAAITSSMSLCISSISKMPGKNIRTDDFLPFSSIASNAFTKLIAVSYPACSI